jgi:hypothetical protein
MFPQISKKNDPPHQHYVGDAKVDSARVKISGCSCFSCQFLLREKFLSEQGVPFIHFYQAHTNGQLRNNSLGQIKMIRKGKIKMAQAQLQVQTGPM